MKHHEVATVPGQARPFENGLPEPLNPCNPAPVRRVHPELPDLVCLSHLRWDFVYQRPQHLLSRAARNQRVWFVEEPVWGSRVVRLEMKSRTGGVRVLVPHLPAGMADEDAEQVQLSLLDDLLEAAAIQDYVLWYYTPMALGFTRHLRPRAIVYDCMDELSLFRGAPPLLGELEAELLKRADLVFTGGRSLYEAKRDRHPHVHLFPSSIDRAHFATARERPDQPQDQSPIPRPRLGYFGVIDERMDLELLARLAEARRTWQLVMVGPVAKVDPAELPRRPNIHYLGARAYEDLPRYIAGWDVALLPFARNEATRFISPTKTPEYLAAGRPVVSTPIRDVVYPYGAEGLVRIADTVAAFIREVEAALAADDAAWLARVDRLLAEMSWDRTWAEMAALVHGAVASRHRTPDSSPMSSIGAAPPAGLVP